LIPLSTTAVDHQARRMPPVALLGVTDAMRVMHDEIFGPLLPIIPYKALGDAIHYVAARPRPLALYYFGRDDGDIDRVLRETHSGGVTINDVILHIAQDDLPFGGVGPSGMGAYHGDARNAFATYSTSLLGDGAARGTRWRYGLGVRYEFTKAFGIHAELERYSPLGSPLGGEPDSDLVSVGVAWRF
jgi:hypothetical protein